MTHHVQMHLPPVVERILAPDKANLLRLINS